MTKWRSADGLTGQDTRDSEMGGAISDLGLTTADLSVASSTDQRRSVVFPQKR